MDEFLEDLNAGRIQFRDKWQFELKTELFPFSDLKDTVETQEFYFFIPNSLQINDQTYSKDQFYHDQTNLIRFKTPIFTLKQLNDPNNAESPLMRILAIADDEHDESHLDEVQEEIKLLGNIFPGSLRNRMAELTDRLKDLKTEESKTLFVREALAFCDELDLFRHRFNEVQVKFLKKWDDPLLKSEFEYVDEFISTNINDFLTGFLNRLRTKHEAELNPVDKRSCEIILKEKIYRQDKFHESIGLTNENVHDEFLLYRKGLLSKFVIDPLLLKTSRASVNQRFRGLILGIPAAVAMLIYLLLYLWQGNVFLFNSEPFILLTVVLYVLKDRLKEELRSLSYRQAAKWFSDYTTIIRLPMDEAVLGTLQESVSFVNEEKVPEEIINIRNREFHGVLETFKRPEQIIYYKKTVNIKKKPKSMKGRFYGFSLIFRFDIHLFLVKAEDPYQTYLSLETDGLTLKKVKLPRVYHLNIILKNTRFNPEGQPSVELKKFRLIIDKSGIKRVEHFSD